MMHPVPARARRQRRRRDFMTRLTGDYPMIDRPILRPLVGLTLSAAIAGGLGGCVIVTDKEDWEDDWRDVPSWEAEQERNRDAIDTLQMGMSLDAVRADMGRPEFTEGFERDGQQFMVLRYRTHHRHADGETTSDETTPLVFRDGRLIGWGETVLAETL